MIDERQLLWMGYIILIVVAFSSLFFYVRDSANDVIFKQKALAKDLALTEETILSSPSKISLIYFLNDNVDVSVDRECGIIVKGKQDNAISVSYKCADDSILTKSFDSFNPKEKITFNKNNNRLEII